MNWINIKDSNDLAIERFAIVTGERIYVSCNDKKTLHIQCHMPLGERKASESEIKLFNSIKRDFETSNKIELEIYEEVF